MSRAWIPRNIEERLEEGERLEKKGALEVADSLYREVVEQAPGSVGAARALLRRAHVHRSWGMWAEAVRLAQAGRALAHRHGERDLEAELLNAEGAVHQARGRLEEAEALFHGMLGIALSPRVRGVALQNLGSNAAMRGRFDEAAEHFAESSRSFQAAGYRRGEAFALNNRGRVLLDRGKAAAALEVLERAAALAGELEDLDLEATATLNLAEAHLGVEATEQAMDCISQAMGYFSSSQNPWRVVECLRIQGDIAQSEGDLDQARRAWTRAREIAETLDTRPELAELTRRLSEVGGGRA